EAVIEGSEMLQAFWTRFLEALEKEYLVARIETFQELGELAHGVTAGWNTENIVHQPFHELLTDVVAGDHAFRNRPIGQILMKRDRLCGKGKRVRWGNGHPCLRLAQRNGSKPTLPKALRRVKPCRRPGVRPCTDAIAALRLCLVESFISTLCQFLP